MIDERICTHFIYVTGMHNTQILKTHDGISAGMRTRDVEHPHEIRPQSDQEFCHKGTVRHCGGSGRRAMPIVPIGDHGIPGSLNNGPLVCDNQRASRL